MLVELKRTTRVTALVALRGYLQQNLFRFHVQRIADHCEARNVLLGYRALRGIEQVQPAIELEHWVEGDAQQSVLILGGDCKLRRDNRASALRRVDLHKPGLLDKEHAPIGSNVQFHRLSRASVEDDLAKAAVFCRAAVALFHPSRVLDAAKQVSHEKRLDVAHSGMTHSGVPCPATVVFLTPGNRMVVAHSAIGVRVFVHRRQHVDFAPGVCYVVIPLVEPFPTPGQKGGRWMSSIGYRDGRNLNAWMTLEGSAHKFGEPGPVILRVGCRVDADEASSGLNVSLERSLLSIVKNIESSIEKHDCLELREACIAENGGVLGGDDLETIFRSEPFQCGDSRGDGGVAVSSRLGEHQHLYAVLERQARTLRQCLRKTRRGIAIRASMKPGHKLRSITKEANQHSKGNQKDF